MHTNETKFVELHKQTEHKLDVMRQVFGKYLSIIARAGTRGTVDASRVFLIDGFAGAGGHLSSESPRHQIPGTAVEACIHARNVQRDYPTTRVSVRLIDIDPKACARLGVRVAEFRDDALVHPDYVDVKIIAADFVSQIVPILEETRKPNGSRYCSLWWIDPFGTKTIPKSALGPLLVGRGPEIVINLDVRGIKRQRDAIYSVNGSPKTRISLRATLTALYGDELWDIGALTASAMSDDEQMRDLAIRYVRPFGHSFQFREAYLLRSSDSQVRYLIHLTHSKQGSDAFAKVYESTMPREKPRTALKPADRDTITDQLHKLFAGTTVAFEAMLGLKECALNRAQLKTVLRHAEANGFGTYDTEKNEMRWHAECSKPIALPLEFEQHTEKRRARKVRQILKQPGLFDGVYVPK
ncbi:MAG TPA: three-Cys-motif partner protein TcmP [Candidatus Elarobacter sp.]|nr:three-Cys-motif partner protein TcmP [Candidatus Elarobacter sp.]